MGRFAGLVLAPGAGGRKDQSGLVAIDEALAALGVVTSRIEFPAQTAGRRRPDPPAVCIEAIGSATRELAAQLGVTTQQVAVGGRSFGGRMGSLSAAVGLDVAALVLVSYPLHPPGQPDRLRTEHFGDLMVPCCFVSGTGPLRHARGARGGVRGHPRRGHARVRRRRPRTSSQRARGGSDDRRVVAGSCSGVTRRLGRHVASAPRPAPLASHPQEAQHATQEEGHRVIDPWLAAGPRGGRTPARSR